MMELEDKEQLLKEEEEADIENMNKLEIVHKREMASLIPLRASHMDQIQDCDLKLEERKGKCDLIHPIVKEMIDAYKDATEINEKAFPETKIIERDQLYIEQMK